MRKFWVTIIAVMLGCCLSAPAWAGDAKPGLKFGTDPKIAAVKPRSPVEIKLKRDKDGTYTWEIKGGDADEILRIDSKLREKLTTEKKK